MANENKNGEWVDFGDKIVYIYEKLFDNDIEQLIDYFTDQTLPTIRKSRKKTIENWLAKKSKKPNGFYLHNFKISQYELNGEQLFTYHAFQKWDITQFRNRLDTYLTEKDNFDMPNEMRYIYFFDAVEQKIAYFEITYPQPENSMMIHLNSPIYTSDMTYEGTIKNYKNMTYISVKNGFDYMHYIFKNNVNVYRKELNVFGVAHCVDAPTREPKAYMALLTSTMLSSDDEKKISHKLNFSNRMIADDFSDECVLEKDYFLENFSEKINLLSRDINNYIDNAHNSKDMYYDIVLEEYNSYIELLKNSRSSNDYAIDHKRQSILFALEEMCLESKAEATIAYLLTSETLSILDSKNSIMEMQLKLVREGKLTLSYLFIIQDLSLLTDRVVEQIGHIEEHGIVVSMTDCNHSIYSKILLVKDKDFAIYKRKNETDDNHVTRNATTIETLSFEIEHLAKKSVPLQTFIEQNYALNGRWYSYSYNSMHDSQSYQMVEFTIRNSSVVAKFPQKVQEGELYTANEFTLLLLEHSVIKIHNIYIHNNIFRISIIGKEHNMYNRDVLLFGLMSREKLSEDQVFMLLDSIHQKDDEEFRIKISNEFDSTLASFDLC